jgi:hypothetical protein
MENEVEVGVAGSLTMIVLFSSVFFLLRSFFKRYKRMEQDETGRENEGDN